MDERKTAAVFKALCDENRIRILKLLTGGEKCACKLLDELSVTQPTLSHHMKILCDSEIVVGRKEGKWTLWCKWNKFRKWMYYSISEQGAENARNLLRELTTVSMGCKAEPCCEG